MTHLTASVLAGTTWARRRDTWMKSGSRFFVWGIMVGNCVQPKLKFFKFQHKITSQDIHMWWGCNASPDARSMD